MKFSNKVLICALGMLMLFAASQLFATEPQIIGPEGGDVRSLAYDPQNPDRVFLGTSSGQMFVSTDSGMSWSRFAHIGDGSDYVLDHIFVDAKNSKTIYVAAWSVDRNYGELFRTRNDGNSWSSMEALKGKSIRSLAIAPENSKLLVAGTLDGIYRSADGGDSWNRISPMNIKNIQSLAIDPQNPDVIYAGTWRLAYKTSDGGATWHQIGKGMDEDSDVFSIVVDPQTPANVYASACTGIYKSTKSGEMFTKIETIPQNARRVRMLKQDPSHPEVLYAGTTAGLWKSLNSGATWTRVSAANVIVNDIMINPRDSRRLLVATDRGGVLMSNNAGATFAAANTGFAHRQVRAMAVDKNNPNFFYAGVVNDKDFGGVFVSQDAGSHWAQLSSGLNGRDVFALAQDSKGNLVAGTNNGLFRMDTTTHSWNSMVIPQLARPYVNDVRINGDAWFIATTEGFLYSIDNGNTWQIKRSPSKEPFSMVRNSDTRIAAATYNSLLTSHDGGRTWAWMQGPSVSMITGMVFDKNAQIWLSTPEGIFHEKMTGGWEYVPTNLPAGKISLNYDQRSDRMFAVINSSSELYASADGHKWHPVHDMGFVARNVVPVSDSMIALTQYDGIVSFSTKEVSAKLQNK